MQLAGGITFFCMDIFSTEKKKTEIHIVVVNLGSAHCAVVKTLEHEKGVNPPKYMLDFRGSVSRGVLKLTSAKNSFLLQMSENNILWTD